MNSAIQRDEAAPRKKLGGWRILKAFLNRNPAYADAREPLMAWYRQGQGGRLGDTSRREAGHP
jgi:hypothetical protein